MSVKELLVRAPELCGGVHPVKHAKMAELAWNHERDNNGFPRIINETAEERIAFLFDWSCRDEMKRDYIQKLVELNVLAHYVVEHGDNGSVERRKALETSLSAVESSYPDVAAVLSVSDASRGWWGD